MKKIIILLILIGLLFSCREDNPAPYYEVIPIVEVYNPFFDDVEKIRLNNTLTINGVSTTQTWDIQFNGARFGCGMLKWTSEAIEHVVGTHLEFNVSVMYDLILDGQEGFTLLDNYSNNNLVKQETWIRAYFEVRDKHNQSNKYLGIEEWSNPNDGQYQANTVVWTVTDPNNIPSSGSIAFPNSGARIADFKEIEECKCSWIKK
jgi:hypothetical protein